ncbi:HAD-IA family hydrolase [Psychromonas antarctica]|uniref:HAD-IA family hydrolase n=1 Tax=Psychromonas antarctica TaxID=67573 RepID=UPI001EE8431C|nr:HAD-IA family hydrolase [Psychromonas antarctica]MCG6202160.1 HAD-IA family hydrolase [Psychromonas antarctica]
MKYYRPIKPFKAISFDLDDTLYDNHPIIKKAEDNILIHLNNTYPELAELTQKQWLLYRDLIVKEFPEVRHDVSLWRIKTLTRIMTIYGIPQFKAIAYANAAFDQFIALRSDFVVPQQSIDLLEKLAHSYPVIAITNGNVDEFKIQLQDKFQFILKAGNGFKSKPQGDLFIEAAQRLNIEVSDILHVGDHLLSDVYGAQNNGAQAVWFNPNQQSLSGARLLPSVEISSLEQLYNIV